MTFANLAGCGRFDVVGITPGSNLKNGSHELAVVALSTHSGDARMTEGEWSRLSRIAHMGQAVVTHPDSDVSVIEQTG
jgi:hypothetical protein